MTVQQSNNLKYGIGAIALIGVVYLAVTSNKGGGATNDPIVNGNNAASFNAQNVANDLLEAMRYLGTDEEEVVSILKYVTQDQFGKVFTAFGKQQYNKTLGNQQNPTAWFDELPFENLKTWLKNELSTEEYNILRLKYPKYL
jgi:hypothetical protein